MKDQPSPFPHPLRDHFEKAQHALRNRHILTASVVTIGLAGLVATLVQDQILHMPPGWTKSLVNLALAMAIGGPYLITVTRREFRRRITAEDEVRRHSESQTALFEIARLSLLDLAMEDFLGGVLDCIMSVHWLCLEPHGGVFLADPDGKTLSLRAYRGDDPDSDICTRVPMGRCVCGRAAQSRHIECIAADDGDHMRKHPSVWRHTHYCAPILLGERCLGVLKLQMQPEHQRDERELLFLEAAGNLIAVILARKNAEEERSRLATAIEQTTETVVITDPDGNIVYVNPAFSRVTGYAREESLGRNPRMLKSGKHGREFYETLWQTIGHGKVWNGRLTNKKKDGTCYEQHMTISPIKDGSGQIVNYVAVWRDVTAQVTMEEQLRRSQKMEAVGLLAGGIAHDFNNVLTTIVGYNYFLLEGLESGHPLRPYSQEIRRSAELAASLTRQFLAVGRTEVVQPRPIDPNSVILAMSKMLRRLVGENIKLYLQPAESVWPVMMDCGQLEQVILNLVVNARDAMPKGGRLTLTTKNITTLEEKNPDPHINLPDGQYMTLEIRDTGVGMSAETKARIFEPFFTTKDPGRGTGLGLATVRGIVKQYEGYISVDSEPDKGTVFRIYLPRVDGGVEALLPGDVNKSTKGGDESIMIVEDNDALRTLIKRALRQKGYRVFASSTAEEALSHFRKHNDRIDLLLTDLVLTDMDGAELAKQFMEMRPGLRVAYMSGYPSSAWSIGALRADSILIEKPFSPDMLLSTLRKLLDANRIEAH
ncbi:MAG TPA: hypothetical protein DEB40_11515 [Elusimicrobia bacterium]|nr:hypothetical protein [Elusimicrobiota bacterium]HBT62361.1 hypothetical protein [Elusimicrobiota bacterium]